MFKSKAEHYDLNLKQADSCKAAPALMTAPDGKQEAAVVLFSMRQIRGVLPLAEALRLANEIADAIATHRASPHN